MWLRLGRGALCAALIAARVAWGIELDLQNRESIKSAARTAADDMMSFYYGNETNGIPGLFGDPYYWWEGGAAFGALIDYWYYTGDISYNEATTQAMLFQVGPYENYEPPNQTKSLGNDDQAFWGMAAMSAAEVRYPNPPPDQPQWLALAQAVFNRQAQRWNTDTCNGGLKWQIFTFNNGYDYKNTITQGCFFNLAARLGAYTGNQTYMDWATKTWEWTANPSIGLITDEYQVWDGVGDLNNCTEIQKVQWSYNKGVFLLGAAVMWNQTTGAEQAQWQLRVSGLLSGISMFFRPDSNIMFEQHCEPYSNCNVDQRSFKAYLARWMAATTKVAPWTHDTIMPLLQASAQAAAASCTGGDMGTICGMRWYTGSFDGQTGVGEQMSALEVMQSMLIDDVAGPVGKDTGGISKGDPNAGANEPPLVLLAPIATEDRAGAWILTVLVIVSILAGAWWMVASEG